jgi:3-(3-hydroxy-phenyl)propionate hydroxylase
MAPPSDPILIVGAGPTGLTLALALGLAGVEAVVLEAEPALAHDLRAGSYHPPTIEMLSRLGLGAALHAAGIIVRRWQVRDRVAGVVAEFDLGLLAAETPFPYRLHLEQHRLTPLLLARIAEAAPMVAVRFSAAVDGVEQDAAGVTVRLAGGERLRGAFAIGCDGARSVVRRAAGIDFPGFTWPERFLVASTGFDLGAIGFAGAGYVADPEHWAAIFHVPDAGPPGLWRVAYGTDPAEAEAAVLAPAAIQERLRFILEHAGLQEAAWPLPLKYASTYRVHQRVAERFAAGRLVLAGDAAHVNNPLGGFGLNGGIHDAIELAEKLARIWHEGAEPAPLLALYDRQRRPINIKAVQAMSIRNKRLLEEKDPDVRRVRLDALRETAGDPAKAKAFLLDSSMINSVREAAAIG